MYGKKHEKGTRKTKPMTEKEAAYYAALAEAVRAQIEKAQRAELARIEELAAEERAWTLRGSFGRRTAAFDW